MSQPSLKGIKPSHRPGTEHGGKRRETDDRRDGHAAIAGVEQLRDQPTLAVSVDVLLLVANRRRPINAPFDQGPKRPVVGCRHDQAAVGGKQLARASANRRAASATARCSTSSIMVMASKRSPDPRPGSRSAASKSDAGLASIATVCVLDLRGAEVGAQAVDAAQIIADEGARPAADVKKPSGPRQMSDDGAELQVVPAIPHTRLALIDLVVETRRKSLSHSRSRGSSSPLPGVLASNTTPNRTRCAGSATASRRRSTSISSPLSASGQGDKRAR